MIGWLCKYEDQYTVITSKTYLNEWYGYKPFPNMEDMVEYANIYHGDPPRVIGKVYKTNELTPIRYIGFNNKLSWQQPKLAVIKNSTQTTENRNIFYRKLEELYPSFLPLVHESEKQSYDSILKNGLEGDVTFAAISLDRSHWMSGQDVFTKVYIELPRSYYKYITPDMYYYSQDYYNNEIEDVDPYLNLLQETPGLKDAYVAINLPGNIVSKFIKNISLEKNASNNFNFYKDQNSQMYQKQLSYYNNDEGAEVFWSSRTAQEKRFEALLDIGGLADKEILDVGCGYADLLKYIEKRDIKIARYVGIDIVPEIVKKAREQHPEVNISCRNIIENPIEKDSFDYVFGSGIFALDNPEYNQYLISMLTSMLNSARVGVAVNFLKQPINDKLSWQEPVPENLTGWLVRDNTSLGIFYGIIQHINKTTEGKLIGFAAWSETIDDALQEKGNHWACTLSDNSDITPIRYIGFNNKLSWKIQSDEFYEFEQALRKNNYEYRIEGDTFVITYEGDVCLYSLQSLPDNIQFNNRGSVYLSSLQSLPDNIQFNNRGSVYLDSLTSLPDNKYNIFKNNRIMYYDGGTRKFDPRVKETLSNKNIKASQLIKLNPEKTLNFIRQHITSKAVLKTGYLEDDFTVFLYKE